MSFGRKATAGASRVSDRAVNARRVMGRASKKPKTNRRFGSWLFFIAAIVIGGGGLWADHSIKYLYNEGIPVVGEVIDSRKVTPSGSSRRYTMLTLRAQHPQFGPIEMELRKPSDPAPLPSGAAATDRRIKLLLHPDDPETGRIASVNRPTSPVWITTIMAIVFAGVAGVNLFSERRIFGSRKTRLRRD